MANEVVNQTNPPKEVEKLLEKRRENQEEGTRMKTIISLWPSLFKTYGGRFLRGSAIGAIHHILVQLFINSKTLSKHYQTLLCIDRSINLITLPRTSIFA